MKILPMLLQFKRSSISREVRVLKEYLKDVHSLAKKEKDKLSKMVEDIVANNPDDAQEIYDDFSEQYSIYDSKYIEIVNNTLLVQSYSYFELQLKEIGRMLKSHLIGVASKPTNKKDDALSEKLKNEIYTMTGLDFSSINSLYIKLDKSRKVRNLIVHNGANLKEKKATLIKQRNYNLVNSISEITINSENGDFFITDKKYIHDYLDSIEEYLTSLVDILMTLDESKIK